MTPSAPALSAGIAPVTRDTTRPIVLIGFIGHGNLGIGYLAAVLRQHGYVVHLYDFETDPAALLRDVRTLQPLLVGFSLIFQSRVRQFQRLLTHLRAGGVEAHFTIGGHFPSLSPREALQVLPELDSVVRFEGECTLLELADWLGAGGDWREILGLAWRDGANVVETPPRPLIADLDALPHPARDGAPAPSLVGRTMAPILASRGCARTCAFCSIHTFYRGAPGRVVRTRKPALVVREMRQLLDERGASIFIFQDDDFPLFGPVWRRWACDLLRELHRQDLVGKVIWRINCRADAVDEELFADMRDAGLYLVYLGLESGNATGLDVLHKQVTVKENIRATDALKEMGLAFDLGFMTFDPSSTFETVRENVAFLRRVVGDGSAAVVLGRMVPYDGTPIRDALLREGRLRGGVCDPDYDFLDARVSRFYESLCRVVDRTGWSHGHRSLSPALHFAWHEAAALRRLSPELPELDAYTATLREITRISNDLLLRVVEDLSYACSDGQRVAWTAEMLAGETARLHDRLIAARFQFVARLPLAPPEAASRAQDTVCA